MKTLTIPELLVLKYLTDSVKPFRNIYKKNVKGLKGLFYEVVIDFLLLFIRDHIPIWMRFRDEPLNNLFSKEEWVLLCDFFGKDRYGLTILILDRWLERRFKQSLTREEMSLLVSDFEKALANPRELIISGKLFLEAMRAGLKKGILTRAQVKDFLDSNQNTRTPITYERCINFLKTLPPEYQKDIADAIAVERNYLQSHPDLIEYFKVMEDNFLMKYFYKITRIHAFQFGKAFSERMDNHLDFVYEIYHKALSKFKRQPGGHFEHLLNKYLWGELKHLLTPRKKFILRDDLACPFCGCDLSSMLGDGKRQESVICPSCGVAFPSRDAFENNLILPTKLPEHFYKNYEGPSWADWTDNITSGGDDPLKDFFGTSEEGSSWEQSGEDKRDIQEEAVLKFDPLILDKFISDTPLTRKEGQVIEAIREGDSDRISMSKVLRQIARDQGKSEHTTRFHYKNAVKKLKNMHKKIEQN